MHVTRYSPSNKTKEQQTIIIIIIIYSQWAIYMLKLLLLSKKKLHNVALKYPFLTFFHWKRILCSVQKIIPRFIWSNCDCNLICWTQSAGASYYLQLNFRFIPHQERVQRAKTVSVYIWAPDFFLVGQNVLNLWTHPLIRSLTLAPRTQEWLHVILHE